MPRILDLSFGGTQWDHKVPKDGKHGPLELIIRNKFLLILSLHEKDQSEIWIIKVNRN